MNLRKGCCTNQVLMMVLHQILLRRGPAYVLVHVFQPESMCE
jgi:hypothetical protein